MATTGTPAPIASSTENGENSWQREVQHERGGARSSAGISARGTRPSSSTGAQARDQRRQLGAAGPSPAIRSGTPARAAASIARSSPFSGDSRPAASA